MPSARCSILRYSYSTVLSPATVRLIPSIEPPDGLVQCSSICALPPGSVCQSPLIQLSCPMFAFSLFEVWLHTLVRQVKRTATVKKIPMSCSIRFRFKGGVLHAVLCKQSLL